MRNIGWAEIRNEHKRKNRIAETIFQVLLCLAIGAILVVLFADDIYRAWCINMGVTP